MKIGADEFMKRIQKIRDSELKGRLSVMLKIEIKTGGAAYRDENDELDRSAYELRRNLKEIMEKLEYGYQSGYIMDVNGNKVGNWTLED